MSPPRTWWADAELAATLGHGPPLAEPWQQTVVGILTATLDPESGDRAQQGLDALVASDAPPEVKEAVALLVAIGRRGADLAALAERAEAFARSAEPAVAARAFHVAGIARTWRGELDLALDDLLAGLESVHAEAPRRYWLLGSVSNILISEGAWTEARAVLDVVARHRTAIGDTVGTAITAGRQATLELGLCNPSAARGYIAHAMSAVGDRIPAFSRLRLATLGLTASIELGAVDEALAHSVEGGIAEVPDGYMRGMAALAMLRARPDGAERWLAIARSSLVDPHGMALVDAWAEHLLSDAPVPEPEGAVPQKPTEGRFLRAVLRSDRALAAGDRDLALRWLDRALALATAANTPLWIADVDRRYAALDPVRSALKASQRFSGLPGEAIERTVQEDVTIIFNDLVGFTRRSQHLSPDEVMNTVRSLFEITAPVLARHRVRPLQYMGDGLLAVAQGPDHDARGKAFATELVWRCGQMSRVRRARGEGLALTTRAGLASGPVVLGLVGSFAKLEHLAIGRTTNLAARLQGCAAPGEVVWMLDPAAPGAADAEHVPLKGFPRPMPIHRVKADATAEPEG
ncbi:MAG: adenylate/guanylate cyclase domain-containing protein [Alphaproteobacteria bacterium]|nr:adenylate/guanylate cyclase domain-containing protein [Alphaproteobacteria bacterium]